MELKPISEFKTCCSGPSTQKAEHKPAGKSTFTLNEIAIFTATLVVWWLVYLGLPDFARYVTYGIFGLSEGTHLAAAVEFFIYDTPKVLMLLVAGRVRGGDRQHLLHP